MAQNEISAGDNDKKSDGSIRLEGGQPRKGISGFLDRFKDKVPSASEISEESNGTFIVPKTNGPGAEWGDQYGSGAAGGSSGN